MIQKRDQVADQATGEILNHKGKRLDELGRELPDPTVMDPPIGYIPQPPLHELIRQMVVSEQLRLAAEAEGLESFEDADDFDVDDETDPSSPWEEQFDPPEPLIPDAPESQPAEAATTPQPQSAAPAQTPVSGVPSGSPT